MLSAGRSAVARLVPALQGTLAPVLLGACLAALGLTGAVAIAWHVLQLPLLDEIGYGDSYILYDVLQFQQTGRVYRDLSRPPYLAAQYSPLVYILFGLANMLIGPANAFVGPRLVVLAAFTACIVLAVSLTRTLVPQRLAWLWAVVLVATVLPIWDWVLQIRADFLGIACGLLATRLLLSEHRHAAVWAGLCAGLAVQFKITFVAAGVAGALWLAGRRQWRSLSVFCLTGAAASVGLYLLYAIREPGMFDQLFTLSPGVPEAAGAIRLVRRAALEPVFLLALIGLPAVMPRDARWWLIVAYAVVSGLIAAATSVQAGANINYYFEPFLIAIPVAVAGWFVLLRQAREAPGVAILLVFLAAQFIVLPRARQVYGDLRTTPSVTDRNREFERLAGVLGRYRLFSTVPRVALLDPAPPLMEPYLLSYLTRMGRAPAPPILAPLHEQRVDAVITPTRRRSFRGIPLIEPEMGRAIAANYSPHCTVSGLLVHTPRMPQPATASLVRELEAIGCEPVIGPIDVVP